MEKNIEKLYLKYTHPALVSFKDEHLNPNIMYTLKELLEVFNMEQIKSLFTPCNFKFDEPKSTKQEKKELEK